MPRKVLCVQMFLSCQKALDVITPALPAWINMPGLSTPHMFWRALGQPAQAEQDDPILHL